MHQIKLDMAMPSPRARPGLGTLIFIIIMTYVVAKRPEPGRQNSKVKIKVQKSEL